MGGVPFVRGDERRVNVQVFRCSGYSGTVRDSAGLGCGTRVRESYVMSAPILSPIPTAKMSMIQLYSLYSIYSLLSSIVVCESSPSMFSRRRRW